MADFERFQSVYLALLALAWDDLEQIGERLSRTGGCEPDEVTLVRLEMFRLEFILLEGWSRKFALRASLTGSGRSRISALIFKLNSLLDADYAEDPGVLRQRVLLAQNWLYDEARSLYFLSQPEGETNSLTPGVAL